MRRGRSNPDLLIGIDLGTTGIKAALCSPRGEVLGESYLEYPLLRPAPGVVEQDAALWWSLTVEAVQRVMRAAGVSRERVRALSVSSQGISFVPVDEEGHPLGPAINWLDTRAADEAEIIRRRFSDADLFALTGKRASPAYVLPKLLWLRMHRADLYHRAFKFLMGLDYLLFHLCGRFVTDHTMAGGTLLYDITRLEWSETLLDAFDISVSRLPEVRWAGTPLGTLRPQAAEEMGLWPGAVVVVGGQDQKCAALGASIHPGAATVSLGTASAVSALVDRPRLDPRRRIPLFPFVVPGYWDLEGVVGTAGGALRWLRETLFPDATYDDLSGLAADSPPGANGVCFYPHLSGAGSPHWRADVWGAFTGLTLAAGAADLVRSVFEGVAMQIRENLEAMQEIGCEVGELILFGGGARSSLWPQVIADVTARPVTVVAMPDVANWGAALLAGIGAGVFDGDPFVHAATAESGRHLAPRARVAARYDEVYVRYRDLEFRLLGDRVR